MTKAKEIFEEAKPNIESVITAMGGHRLDGIEESDHDDYSAFRQGYYVDGTLLFIGSFIEPDGSTEADTLSIDLMEYGNLKLTDDQLGDYIPLDSSVKSIRDAITGMIAKG